MAKEVKLGLTAIGILLAVFCSVLVIKLRRPTDTPPAADIAQALGESREPEQPKLASGPSKLTILSPNDKPESTPRGDSATGDSAADDSAANDGGPQFSTDRYARRGAATAEAKRSEPSDPPRPSFLRQSAPDKNSDPDDRYAGRDRYPRQPKDGDASAAAEPSGAAAKDAGQGKDADPALKDVAADGAENAEKFADPFGRLSRKSRDDQSAANPETLQRADDVQLTPSPRSATAKDATSSEISPTAGQGNEPSGQAGDQGAAVGDDRRPPPAGSHYDIYGGARRDEAQGRGGASPGLSGAGGAQRTDQPPDARMPYRSQAPLPDQTGGSPLSPRGEDLSPRAPVYTQQGETYTVQPNDSYWTISEKVYGTGGYFKAIQRHNQVKSGRRDALSVGQTLAVPTAEALAQKYPDLCPKPRQRPADRGVMMNAAAGARDRLSGGGRVYVVEKGDTLFDIARYELGKASRWNELYELNKDQLGEDFDYLAPGTKLILPDGGQPDPVTSRPRNPYQR